MVVINDAVSAKQHFSAYSAAGFLALRSRSARSRTASCSSPSLGRYESGSAAAAASISSSDIRSMRDQSTLASSASISACVQVRLVGTTLFPAAPDVNSASYPPAPSADPRHHAAQALADLLDWVLGELCPRRLERGLVDAVLEHPVAGELARLDVGQHPLHLGLGLGRDDARPGDVLAVLGGVRDRVVHVGDAALVDEVDDQLHLVQALEIRHLGRVAGLDERLVAGLDEFDEAAAEHGLLAEEVGLALLLEAR